MHRSRSMRLGLLAALAASVAATPLTSVISAQAMTGPEVADGSRDFTVRLDIGSGTRSCSGALVDAQWVLTAKSCFADNPVLSLDVPAGAPKLATTATIGRTDLTTTAGQVRKIVSLVPRADRDVVLARLDAPVTGVTPVAVATSPATTGESLTSAGFGRTKTEWAPLKLHTGTFGVTDVQAADIDMQGKNGESVCPGDTGGPLLRENGGTAQLVGVNSRSFQAGCFGIDTTETRTDAISTRVDDLAGWIAKNRLAVIGQDQIRLITTADFNHDGRPDIAAILKDGNIHAFYATSDGTLVYGRELWRHDGSWGGKARIFGGDFNGDGNGDIAALKADGTFDLYPGTADGQLGSAKSMWKDDTWKSFPSVATYRAKGWTRDGLVTVAPTGRLYAYPTGADGILDGTRTEVWHDDTWDKKLITSADFNGDQLNDVAAISQKGELDFYAGKSDGMFDFGKNMWTDQTWGTYGALMGGDFNGDGKADIAATNSAGNLYLYPGDGNGSLGARKSMWPQVG
ncbi:trypsin-like serine protease [Streptomyces misionensis]|uniref:trypsin-like serine protease n=1 Tax=Streptomyces misionensis TaxID=67331 RepID=UPI0033CF5760